MRENEEVTMLLSDIYEAKMHQVIELFNTLIGTHLSRQIVDIGGWECQFSSAADPEILVELLKQYQVLIPSPNGGWDIREGLTVEDRDLREVILTMAFITAANEVSRLEKVIGKVKEILDQDE